MKGDRLMVTRNGKLIIEAAQLPGIPLKDHWPCSCIPNGRTGMGGSLVQFRNIMIKQLGAGDAIACFEFCGSRAWMKCSSNAP